MHSSLDIIYKFCVDASKLRLWHTGSIHLSIYIYSTLVLQDLLLIWAVLMSSKRAKKLLSTDWSNVTLLNFVKLSILLIKKGSHKRYATLTILALVWALWSFKILFWSELYWWALKERNSCCLQIDWIIVYIYIYIYIYIDI